MLFGSALRGLKPLSDVDVMAKFERKLEPIELGELIASLEAVVKRPVDLVEFSRAPPGLRYEAMKGIKLYVRDINEFLEDYVKSVNEWLDFKPAWERMARARLCRLLERFEGRRG
ncbi:MAG: nucleotidyltransferase domain-containing protein [Crenarchaeota archaeon]|nr:nucleotidyltransferase domain-containing protein [Thermoproteota archaeon]